MASKLTQEGYEKLRKELDFLQTTKRQEVIQAIAVARAHGDLKENAEYDAAKNEQAFLEKRIADLDDILSDSVIIDETDIDTSKVYLGAKVTLLDKKRKKEVLYMLVSQAEANFADGKISADSPVGAALLGKGEGDDVEISIPAGVLQYTVLKIAR